MFSSKTQTFARGAWPHLTGLRKTLLPSQLSLSHTASPSFSSFASPLLSKYNFETLQVTSPCPNVLQVSLNRPDKLNAMNKAFWLEMSSCFDEIADDDDCRAVVVAAEGRIFTAGLDLGDVSLVQVKMMHRESIKF